MSAYFEYRHIVGLEETNLTGNVYFANHLRWQGRCREMFLHRHAPSVVAKLSNGLTMLTIRCACDYISELFAMDEVSIRMFLEEQILNRLILRFEYWRVTSEGEQLAAKGLQEIACMLRGPNGAEGARVPEELLQALLPYKSKA